MRLAPLAVLVAAPLLAHAQDTGGVQTEPSGGTVVKGKAPVAKEVLKVRFPKPKSFKLTNGLVVYVMADHRVPAVRFNLQIRAGTLFEPKPGVAGLTASMLTEGTSTRTNTQLAEATENIGASLGANAGPVNVNLTAAGLTEYTDTLLDLLMDVLMHPAYPQDRLDRAKTSSRSAASQRRTSPAGMVGDLSTRVLYGETKYGRAAATNAEVNAVTREDLVAYHEAWYRPNSALLGVTGDVDPGKLKAQLERVFADWKPGTGTTDLPKATFPAKAATRIYLIDRPGSAQTVLQFGCLAVAQTDPDYIPLTVANRILGGGSSARLFQNIREQKGYTYGAYSSLTGGLWPGVWGANASVRTEVTEPAVAEFFKEFSRLQDETVSEAELARAKRALVGGFARTLESPEGVLNRTLELIQNGLPPNYWDTYPAKIQAVTAADIKRVAQKYLGGGRVQLFAVGERAKIETGLAKFGPVEVVDPTKR